MFLLTWNRQSSVKLEDINGGGQAWFGEFHTLKSECCQRILILLCPAPSESAQSLKSKKEFIALPEKKIEQALILLHPQALPHLPDSQTEEIDGTQSNGGPLSHSPKSKLFTIPAHPLHEAIFLTRAAILCLEIKPWGESVVVICWKLWVDDLQMELMRTGFANVSCVRLVSFINC